MPPEILPQQIIPPTESHQASPEAKPPVNKMHVILIASIVLVVTLIIAGGIWVYLTPKVSDPGTALKEEPTPIKTTSTVSISGLVDINGTLPQGSTLTIRARDLNQATNSANIVAIDIPAKDNTSWTIKDLENGKSYEVYGRITSNNKIIGASEPQFISAPATKESIRINIDPNAEPQSASASAVISGTIRTNGYIPANSTIMVEGKKYGSPTFTTIANNLPGQKSQFLSFTTAISGQSYEIRGKLMNAGKVIGTSNTILLTAPAENEILEINSTASSPTATNAPSTQGNTQSGPSTISGYINLNGAAPEGATMVILSRASGTTNYQTVQDSISAKDDAPWMWNGGQIGKSYDLKAVLKKPNGDGTYSDVSTSNTITVTSPAENQQLSINSSFQLPSPPGGNISINCKTKNSSTNQWSAVLNYGSIENANAYWFQVGTTNGGNDYVNTSLPAVNGDNQITNVTLNDSVTYFARYAYSYNQNANTNNQNEFSPFSQTLSFKCPK